VYRCKSKTNDERKGPFHYSDDSIKTLCGKDIDENWYICDNTFSGTSTCKECLRIDKETSIHQRAEKKRNSD